MKKKLDRGKKITKMKKPKIKLPWKFWWNYELMSKQKKAYRLDKYPKCYRLCPLFYHICNHGAFVLNDYDNPKYDECLACVERNGFGDSIE